MVGKYNRIEWIDIAKGIAIILVVMGHTGLESGSAHYLNSFIYSFHLPLFFVLSGYFFKDYQQIGGKYEYLKRSFDKKIYSLLIPYFTYTIINRIWGVPLNYFHNHELSFNLQQIVLGTLLQIRDSSLYGGVVWFIGWMFTTYMLSIIISILFLKDKYRIIVSILCCAIGCLLLHYKMTLPWHLDAALVAVLFLRIGYEYKINEDRIEQLLNSCNGIISLLLLYLTSAVCNYILSGNYPDMFSGRLGNPFLYIIEAISGSLLIIWLSKKFIGIKGLDKLKFYMLDIGRNSLTIYGLHRLTLGVFGVLYRIIFPTQTGISQILRAIVLTFISILIIIPVSHMLRKYLPVLFGYKKYTPPTIPVNSSKQV